MLEDNQLLSRLVARFHIVVATVVSLIVAAIFGSAAGEGDFFFVYLGLFIGALVVVMLQLGNLYWLIVPFSFVCELPAIPMKNRLVELPEIVTATCMAVFLIRYALKRQTFTLFRIPHVPVQLFTAWAGFILLLHPVGLADLGAAAGGLRFYAKIALALVAFLIVANQNIGEKECRWVMISIVIGALVSTAKEIVFFYLGIGTDVSQGIDPDAYYTWHQAIAVPGLAGIMLLLSRHRSSELFSMHRLGTLGLFLLCVGLIVVSGKRAAVASIPLLAVTAAVVRKEFGFVVLWIVGAVIASGIVVVGQGDLFRLPLTAQRALSILPARWDVEISSLEGGKDDFRDMLRILAMEKIQRDPWIGTGYKVDMQMIQGLMNRSTTGSTEDQVMPAALGSSWHNTWLGYAADFGIPASILVGVIYLTVTYRSWRTFHESPSGSATQAMSMYMLLFTVRDVAFSHTGGHSANDAFARWWLYGLIVALTLTNRQRMLSKPATDVLIGNRMLTSHSFTSRPARQSISRQR